ncbi:MULTISPECIES: hypothetical protein [Methylocystis]|uniref:Uncharacterized protein n=1 Tax=Methylocystis iwaonis TaxID=2885079 RepID=A0ABM8E885_9HYPH|nr:MULTISPECIES: hypothetical protein [Methylocystis]MDJ0448364.1 hypothetical protein [Methylocystis sp. JR02]BDV34075.1 hypothetical protein SS37A_16040 [Methylocystis iwaonis]
MRKLTLLTIAALLTAAGSAHAQSAGPFPSDGNIQSYGGHWRYQHRDWSAPGRPLNPGVCWQWSDSELLWKWVC